MTCHAAQCTVQAVTAVRWLDLRRGRSRTEPICEGHRIALREATRRPDPFTHVEWVTLDTYQRTAAFSLADLFRPA